MNITQSSPTWLWLFGSPQRRHHLLIFSSVFQQTVSHHILAPPTTACLSLLRIICVLISKNI